MMAFLMLLSHEAFLLSNTKCAVLKYGVGKYELNIIIYCLLSVLPVGGP